MAVIGLTQEQVYTRPSSPVALLTNWKTTDCSPSSSVRERQGRYLDFDWERCISQGTGNGDTINLKGLC